MSPTSASESVAYFWSMERLRRFRLEPDCWSRLPASCDDARFRIGDGVRELDDASEGDGVMEPSSEAGTESVSCSVPSSIDSAPCLREALVLTTTLDAEISPTVDLRVGLTVVLATRCLGARGGLLAAG